MDADTPANDSLDVLLAAELTCGRSKKRLLALGQVDLRHLRRLECRSSSVRDVRGPSDLLAEHNGSHLRQCHRREEVAAHFVSVGGDAPVVVYPERHRARQDRELGESAVRRPDLRVAEQAYRLRSNSCPIGLTRPARSARLPSRG